MSPEKVRKATAIDTAGLNGGQREGTLARMSTHLTGLLIAIVVAVAMIVLGLRLSRARNRTMKRLSQELGLPLLGGEPAVPKVPFLRWMKKSTWIEGVRDGRDIKIYHFTRSSGKNRNSYAAMQLPVRNPLGLHLSIVAEGYLSKIARAFGMQDIQIGDERFDKAFIIKSKTPDFPPAILMPEVRELFYKAWEEHAAHGWLHLKGNTLMYEEFGSICTGAAKRRFIALTKLGCLLADAIEAYTDARQAAEPPRD